jgi:hypothetical protein
MAEYGGVPGIDSSKSMLPCSSQRFDIQIVASRLASTAVQNSDPL